MAKKEDAETILVAEERAWATDLPNDILHEIFSRVFAGDRVAFRSVCRSWSSVSPLTGQQHLVGPLTKPDCSHPYLMYANENIFHPICGDLYPLEFPDMPGTTICAARDDWLLMRDNMSDLFFFNPFTKAKVIIPWIRYYTHTQYMSSPPTSKDWLVVAVVGTGQDYSSIYSIRSGDENWTLDISLGDKTFDFSRCNAIVHKGMYYFLGTDARLLVYDPKRKEYQTHKPPKDVSQLISPGGKQYKFEREQYMLECDGKLLFVFVGYSGIPVHVCCWNVSTRTWETIENLGNKMLFVSRPLSLSLTAIVTGTGNKIYFPRRVGKNGLFYSLSTKKYHTFEIGTSRQSYEGSKFPLYATWIRP